jgi:hypothetical protein
MAEGSGDRPGWQGHGGGCVKGGQHTTLCSRYCRQRSTAGGCQTVTRIEDHLLARCEYHDHRIFSQIAMANDTKAGISVKLFYRNTNEDEADPPRPPAQKITATAD